MIQQEKVVAPTERFGIYAETETWSKPGGESRPRTYFIAVQPEGRFITKPFPGVLSNEAARKAWEHQRHLFTPIPV